MERKAYAKINLSLDILGRREDGYHLLRMVMQSVSLYDTLAVEKKSTGGVSFTCNLPEVPRDETNTAVRAAWEFFHEAGIQGESVSIALEKRIPSQAGLGGGSADAAAVLHALNSLYGNPLTLQQLCAAGLRVGADVPFCVQGGTRLAQGVGEKLTPAPGLPDCHVLICKPPFGVSTAAAFARADSGRVPARQCTGPLLEALASQKLSAIGAALGNAFEALLDLPQIRAIENTMLSGGAAGACMTGSGSAVYGLFQNEEQALACRASLEDGQNRLFVCRPLGEA